MPRPRLVTSLSPLLEIERNIPLPSAQSGIRKYPFAEMGVGDSFFVPGVPQSLIGSAASSAAKASGRKYTTRKVEGGVRVWRVS